MKDRNPKAHRKRSEKRKYVIVICTVHNIKRLRYTSAVNFLDSISVKQTCFGLAQLDVPLCLSASLQKLHCRKQVLRQ
jgi:hypothetical protein